MEEAVQFLCGHHRLYGIVHMPPGIKCSHFIVIIVTGGPQIRAGAHRLYVQLSRFLSGHGIPTMRFDYEGMGDSEGRFVGFSGAGPSIAAAVSFLQKRYSPDMKIVFWSLCDGATATALYCAAHSHDISGMILCNPLILTDEGLARSTFRHYYWNRLFDKDFLGKLLRFQLDFRDSFSSLWAYLKSANFISKQKHEDREGGALSNLPRKVFRSLHKFPGPVRIILSTNDIVASNFLDELKKHKELKQDYKTGKVSNFMVQGADHTFVDPDARDKMFSLTLQLLDQMVSS